MSSPAILVEDLTKTYGSVQALQGIDFEVPAGTIFGLLGPNGAGKTTAVRILATILSPTSGRAAVLGYDVQRNAREVRHLIGLAGQSAAVDPNLTGRENLKLIGKLAQLPRREIGRRASELLERFELTQAGDRPIRTYSGGMRRRLDVAAALVAKPPVIFLDEPTTGLDIQSRTELWRVIEELVGDGATVLLTTQYLEEADQLADRIAVVDGGRVVANDTAAALKARLGGSVVEIRMEDEDSLRRAFEVVGSLVPDHSEVEGLTVRFSTNDPTQVLTQALRGLDSHALNPAGIAVHEPSLDDVFLSLTGNGDNWRRPAGATRARAAGRATSAVDSREPAPPATMSPNGARESLYALLGNLAFRAGSGDVVENLAEAAHIAVANSPQGLAPDDRATALLAGYITLEQRFGRISDRFPAEEAAWVLLGAAAARGSSDGHGRDATYQPDPRNFAYEIARIVMGGIAAEGVRRG